MRRTVGVGHCKIATVMRADGYQVCTSTVLHALRWCGLLLPQGFRADHRSWAWLRKREFHDRRGRGTGSGKWTLTSSRPPRVGSGGFAR